MTRLDLRAAQVVAPVLPTTHELGNKWTESLPSIATTPTLLIDADPLRVYLLIANNTPNNLFIAMSPEVSTTRGILVPPNGGTVIFSVTEDGEWCQKQAYAVYTTASGTPYVVAGTSG